MLERILLIEDSEGEALLVKQMLRAAGLADPVYWMQDATAAMAYLSGEAGYEDRASHPLPEIILLDLAMPSVDGYQFLRWLRAQPTLSKIVVVVLTAEMDPKRIQLAYQLGANSFLAKQANLEEYKNFVDFFRTFGRVANTLPRTDVRSGTLPSITPLKMAPSGESGASHVA